MEANTAGQPESRLSNNDKILIRILTCGEMVEIHGSTQHLLFVLGELFNEGVQVNTLTVLRYVCRVPQIVEQAEAGSIFSHGGCWLIRLVSWSL